MNFILIWITLFFAVTDSSGSSVGIYPLYTTVEGHGSNHGPNATSAVGYLEGKMIVPNLAQYVAIAGASRLIYNDIEPSSPLSKELSSNLQQDSHHRLADIGAHGLYNSAVPAFSALTTPHSSPVPWPDSRPSTAIGYITGNTGDIYTDGAHNSKDQREEDQDAQEGDDRLYKSDGTIKFSFAGDDDHSGQDGSDGGGGGSEPNPDGSGDDDESSKNMSKQATGATENSARSTEQNRGNQQEKEEEEREEEEVEENISRQHDIRQHSPSYFHILNHLPSLGPPALPGSAIPPHLLPPEIGPLPDSAAHLHSSVYTSFHRPFAATMLLSSPIVSHDGLHLVAFPRPGDHGVSAPVVDLATGWPCPREQCGTDAGSFAYGHHRPDPYDIKHTASENNLRTPFFKQPETSFRSMQNLIPNAYLVEKVNVNNRSSDGLGTTTGTPLSHSLLSNFPSKSMANSRVAIPRMLMALNGSGNYDKGDTSGRMPSLSSNISTIPQLNLQPPRAPEIHINFSIYKPHGGNSKPWTSVVRILDPLHQLDGASANRQLHSRRLHPNTNAVVAQPHSSVTNASTINVSFKLALPAHSSISEPTSVLSWPAGDQRLQSQQYKHTTYSPSFLRTAFGFTTPVVWFNVTSPQRSIKPGSPTTAIPSRGGNATMTSTTVGSSPEQKKASKSSTSISGRNTLHFDSWPRQEH